METRQTTEVKVWALNMNMMRNRVELVNTVATSYDKQKLIDWVESQKAETPYSDPTKIDPHDLGSWHKTFKKGSPLEWYNPLPNYEDIGMYGEGLVFRWVNMADFTAQSMLAVV